MLISFMIFSNDLIPSTCPSNHGPLDGVFTFDRWNKASSFGFSFSLPVARITPPSEFYQVHRCSLLYILHCSHPFLRRNRIWSKDVNFLVHCGTKTALVQKILFLKVILVGRLKIPWKNIIYSYPFQK